jgi:hypothetical protein
VKHALPLGLVLLIGIAFELRRSPSPKSAGERQRSVQRAADSPENNAGTVQPVKKFREAPAPEPSSRPADRAEAKPSAPAISQPGWRKLAATLGKEIVLTPFQRESVERILQERDEEIQACHQAIRSAGVLDLRRYDWQVGLMKERWYSRLDALMDRAQHEQFVALVHKGFLNDDLGFTVEPGMTLLD